MQPARVTTLCQYRYDSLDRLIAHALPNEPVHQRFYCKNRLASEIHGAIAYSIFQHEEELLTQLRCEGDTLDSTLLATDQQRSVLRTLNIDQSEPLVSYTPYGHRQTESGWLSLLGFNGERPDPVTGLYLLGNGYRAFNPALMRFNSPDRDSFSPFGRGGLNPYCYCLGDPINFMDKNGHNPTMKIISSTLIFSKGSSIDDVTIASAERITTKIKSISKRTTLADGSFSQKTTVFKKRNTEVTFLEKFDDTMTLMRPGYPAIQYPAELTLKDLAYSAIKPKTLTSADRKFARNMVPPAIDERNRQNLLSKLEFELHHEGIPARDFARTSRALHRHEFEIGNIRGAFPEKFASPINPVAPN
ncbi:RHS repeat-associated core domain protein-containing protein [Pseudomonas sp. IT-P12]|uniref:RHS repeat-associated core domain-containing protein n=1 Tax=Pseudomonas sp. IT-P12 TaxID=3026450 RepID=UPI0039E1E98D